MPEVPDVLRLIQRWRWRPGQGLQMAGTRSIPLSWRLSDGFGENAELLQSPGERVATRSRSGRGCAKGRGAVEIRIIWGGIKKLGAGLKIILGGIKKNWGRIKNGTAERKIGRQGSE